jgi:ribosome-binding protein aMBF1 (putative translation factor)
MTEPVAVLRDGERPAFAVLRWDDFERLRGLEEDARDVADAERKLADPGRDEIPAELVARMLDEGVHPVRAWREHRGLTQEQLAAAAGLRQPDMARIESRQRKGTVAQMRRLAEALGVSLDTLVATLD